MSRIERTLAGGKSTRAHFKNVIHFTFVTGSDRITAESFDAPRAEAAESTSSLTGRACAASKHKATTQLMKYVSNIFQYGQLLSSTFKISITKHAVLSKEANFKCTSIMMTNK